LDLKAVSDTSESIWYKDNSKEVNPEENAPYFYFVADLAEQKRNKKGLTY
jgi:hypothetical protein